MTKTEQYIQRLMDAGFIEIETRSTKSKAFYRTDKNNYVFVGKRASIRYGRNKSQSVPIRDHETFFNIIEKEV